MNIFAENAMLELSYLKSLHLKSAKQKRLFLSLNDGEMFCYFAVMGTVMEDEQKLCQTELLNTRAKQTKKNT